MLGIRSTPSEHGATRSLPVARRTGTRISAVVARRAGGDPGRLERGNTFTTIAVSLGRAVSTVSRR